MISSIELKNFMNHESSKIEFSDGVTAITGLNDNGKSVIFYSIRWFMFDEPRGKAVIRHGQDSCSVIINFDDGFSVSKTKSAAGTSFEDSNGETYYKADTPQEYLDRIGIENFLKEFDLEANFSWQLDAPFILSLPGSKGSKIFSSFIGLDVLDGASSDAEKHIRQCKTTIKNSNVTLSEFMFKYKKTDIVDDIDINKFEADAAKIQSLEAAITAVNAFANKIGKTEASISKLKSKHDILKDIPSVKYVESLIENVKKVNDINSAVTRISSLETNLEYSKNALSTIKKYYNDITMYSNTCTKKLETRDSVVKLINSITSCNNRLNKVHGELAVYNSLSFINNNLFSSLESNLQKQGTVNKHIKELGQLASYIKDLKVKLAVVNENLFLKQEEFNDKISNGFECPLFNKACPLV